MKKVILIDMENMQYAAFENLESLSSEYEIVFFESLYTVSIPDTKLLALDKLNVRYSFEWVDRTQIGKNSMDFCIVAYLALRSNLAPEEENYFILSKDRDFNIPNLYITAKTGIHVKTISSIKQLIGDGEFDYKEITDKDIIELCIEQATSLHELHNLMQKTLKGLYTTSEIGYLYRSIVEHNRMK